MLQWVPAGGFDFSVRRSSVATLSSEIERGRPERSSSYSPRMRRSMNRCRHLPTVALDHRSRVAISKLERPSADHSTSLARATSA